jgi:hypothetical protein
VSEVRHWVWNLKNLSVALNRDGAPGLVPDICVTIDDLNVNILSGSGSGALLPL